MKLAVLSDIHGNWPALQAVLARLPQDCAIACSGDFTGYYPHANEVCTWARSAGIVAIRGNHDSLVTCRTASDASLEMLYRTAWIREHLDVENLAWLSALPAEVRLNADGVEVILRHASPWDETTYLYPDSPRWSEVSVSEGQVLVLGHTHRPLIRRCGAGIAVNPGSVGQPRDGDSRACHAVYDSATRAWEHVRTEYNYADYQAVLRAMGWAEETVAILSRKPKSS